MTSHVTPSAVGTRADGVAALAGISAALRLRGDLVLRPNAAGEEEAFRFHSTRCAEGTTGQARGSAVTARISVQPGDGGAAWRGSTLPGGAGMVTTKAQAEAGLIVRATLRAAQASVANVTG